MEENFVNMDNRPIGVFDSGLGGLTAVKEIKKVLPNESILYFGDTGRVPYGTRSRETIRRYAAQDINFLLKHDVKAIVAACGTASSNCRDLGESLGLPYIDIITPSAKAAVDVTKNKKIGILGTTATIKSNSFLNAIQSLDKDIEVFTKACPLFVSLVENGFIEKDDEVTKLVAKRYLEEMKNDGVDTIILGCTHFPIIKSIIGGIVGDDVRLIDSGKETARHCASVLEQNNLLCDEKHDTTYKYYLSDNVESFLSIAQIFLGTTGEKAKRIDIEQY